MHKTSKLGLATGVVLVAVAFIASVLGRVCYVREDSAGQLLWNNDQAYLFIKVSQHGWRVRYLEYPWMVFKEYVRVGVPPDDEHRDLTVLRITSSAIERHMVDLGNAEGGGTDFYTPSGDRIYANCSYLGGLCVWAGDHFAQASGEDQRKFDGITNLSPDIDTDLNGWTKRGIGRGFKVNVGGNMTLSGRDEAVGHPFPAVSIFVERQGRAPERIWSPEGRSGRVSKAEYERVFGRR